MRELRSFGWLPLSLIVSLAACGSDDDGDDGVVGTDTETGSADESGDESGDTGSQAGSADIRVIHGSPTAPAVDVYVAGTDEPVITNLAYGETSEYLSVPAGEYAFEIRPAGAPASDDPVFTTDTLTLPEGATVSALAAGLIGSDDAEQAFRVLPLVEEFTAPGAGEAIVRIVHAGSDAPTVDIDVGNDGSAELTGVGRFADSGATGVPLPAGQALQVGIVAGGETVTAFTTPALPEGAEIFVIATGLLQDLPRQESGFSLLAVAPTGSVGFIDQNPRVYAFHGSPDAPAVDICAGGQPLLADVPFGAMAPIQVPPGEYTLDFFAAPSDCSGDPASSQATPALEAGQQYLAIATGELAPEGDDPTFTLAPFAEDFSLDQPDQGVFTVIHAASAPAVDVGVVDSGLMPSENLLATGLAWPNASDEVAVAPATYPVGVAGAGGTPPLMPLATFEVPVTAGFRGWVAAVGALAPDGEEEAFRLFAIDTTVSPWATVEITAQ